MLLHGGPFGIIRWAARYLDKWPKAELILSKLLVFFATFTILIMVLSLFLQIWQVMLAKQQLQQGLPQWWVFSGCSKSRFISCGFISLRGPSPQKYVQVPMVLGLDLMSYETFKIPTYINPMMCLLVTYGIPRIISNNHIIPNLAIPNAVNLSRKHDSILRSEPRFHLWNKGTRTS